MDTLSLWPSCLPYLSPYVQNRGSHCRQAPGESYSPRGLMGSLEMKGMGPRQRGLSVLASLVSGWQLKASFILGPSLGWDLTLPTLRMNSTSSEDQENTLRASNPQTFPSLTSEYGFKSTKFHWHLMCRRPCYGTERGSEVHGYQPCLQGTESPGGGRLRDNEFNQNCWHVGCIWSVMELAGISSCKFEREPRRRQWMLPDESM